MRRFDSSRGHRLHGAKGVERCDLRADDEHVRVLPSGTVTFLFTDIEGSTRLIEELGEERYVDARRPRSAALPTLTTNRPPFTGLWEVDLRHNSATTSS